MAIEETGLKLVAQNETGFVSAMGNSQRAVSNFVGSVSGGTTSLSGFNLGSLTLANTIGNILANAIQSGIQKVTQIGENVILAAGRFQEMTTVDEMLGQKMGYTNQAVDDQINKVRKLGIEGATAADTVAQFIRYQLDMAKSTDLARVAQDAAVLSNSNSTETLSRLIDGIMTGRTEILRTSGIMVDMNSAYETYAKVLGKTKDALSEDEKVQARLNAVLAAGANIAGSYETAMKEPYKILGSMPRVVNDLAVAIGGPLQSAFGTGLTAAKNFIESMTASFSPGGSLYPSMVTFGRNLNDLVVNLLGVGKAAGNAAGRLANEFGLTMDNLNSKGFAWGYNIINQVVGGMLQGAIDSVGVLTQIGAWLGSWFEANSPPKILPDLDKWGAAAMNAYLQGWTKGDFSIFDEISGMVERSLRSTAGTKDTDTGLIPSILGSRDAIAQAIEQVQSAGSVTTSMLSRLYQTVGASNPAMQAYLKTTLQLSLANDKVAKAQNELNTVTKKYDDLLAPLNAKVAGAQGGEDKLSNLQRISQLQMVLTDVNATAADKEMARLEIEKLQAKNQIVDIEAKKTAEVSAAQLKLDAATADQKIAQDKADIAKAQIQLQTQENDLIRQQINLIDQLAAAATKAAKSGAGGEVKLPTPGALPVPGTKTQIPNYLKEGNFGPANPFQSIIDSMDKLTTKIIELKGKWQWFTDFIAGSGGKILLGVAAFFATYWILGLIAGLVALTISPLTLMMIAISLLVAVMVTLGPKARIAFMELVAVILFYLAQAGIFLRNWFINAWITVSTKTTEIWQAIKDWCINIVNTIKEKVTEFATAVEDWFIQAGIKVDLKIAEIITNVTTFAGNIIKAFTDKIAEIKQAGTDLINGLWDGIKGAWADFKQKLINLANLLPDVIKKILGIASPSQVFAGIGMQMMAGLAQGILSGAKLPNMALASIGAGMVNGPGGGMYAPPSVSHTYSPSWNLTVMTNNNADVVGQSFGLMRILAA